MRRGGRQGDELDELLGSTVEPAGAMATVRRGLAMSPELRKGLGWTLALAVLATGGRVLVPIIIQQTIDVGLLGADGPRLGLVAALVAGGIAALALTTSAAGVMTFRLVRATEAALARLRTRTFRHIHDLSLAHHSTEHRGALVSRVTADIDTISQFMSWGGVLLIVMLAQLAMATAVMASYSPLLALVVIVAVAPLVPVLRFFQKRLSRAYDQVRERVGAMLGALGESIAGVRVIRAYGLEDRTRAKVSARVEDAFGSGFRAARLGSIMFSSGDVFAASAVAAVVAVGVLVGPGQGLTPGQLVAFLFLVNLFVGPVQVATEVLDVAQTAVAGWRRVLTVLDTPADVVDPGEDGTPLPPGPIEVSFDAVRFAYPVRGRPDELGPEVLHGIDATIPAQQRVAIVGQTGSGKTTFAKLLTRLSDPTGGAVRLNGVPLDEVRFSDLRRRVVMVPQDGFLFDASVWENIAYGRPGMGRDDVELALTELRLASWAEGLPQGLDTHVGERGGRLSAGERQLLALARAYVANPDLLVLDEATSSVDPATEARIQRALESLTRGRTAIAIAHRLSTAEAADEVLVFSDGDLVERGPHDRLVAADGTYARLHESWARGQGVDDAA